MSEGSTFSLVLTAHLIYLCISIGMTIWVARQLSRSGEVFLIECFAHDESLARSTNQLLVTGFYLINIGFICLTLNRWSEALPSDFIAEVGSRIGSAVLVLGVMHFINMGLIVRFGKALHRLMRREPSYELASKLPPLDV